MTNYPTINSSRFLYHQASSLVLYQSVFDNEIGKAFFHLLQTLVDDRQSSQIASVNCLQAYGKWFKSLAARQESWQDYLVRNILQDDNPFSQQAQHSSWENLSPPLINAAKWDLKILQNIYNFTSQQVSEWVQTASQLSTNLVVWNSPPSDSNFFASVYDWGDTLPSLAQYYREHGTGIFARYRALRWQGELIGIAHADSINIDTIVGYQTQKEALLKNTDFLLAGYPALNVLLYGSRGSGKSSLVKSLLSYYLHRPLRLIEVNKSQLQDLPLIVEKLRDLPQKFIIFVDDLSFEEDDEAFKSLKVVLEGSLTAKAKNVVVYATSNRRHLIREFFADRPNPSDEEVHAWDTMQEKLSFSDRFGLTLTFEPASQDTYLSIVRHLASLAAIDLKLEDLDFQAKQWAVRHNGRSGRTAKQFIDYLISTLAIN